jgi:hypothetical protein
LKPTPEVVQALANLRPSQDFKTFLAWIEEGLDAARDTCEKHTADEKLYRAQGICQALREIKSTNEEAPKLLEFYKNKTPSK